MANVKILYQQNNTPCAVRQSSTIVLYVPPWRKYGTESGQKHIAHIGRNFAPSSAHSDVVGLSQLISAYLLCVQNYDHSTVLTYTSEIHCLEFDNLSQPHILVCFSGLDPINLRNQSSYHLNISPSKSITDNLKDELRPLKEESRFQSYR